MCAASEAATGAPVPSIDPRTGTVAETVGAESTSTDVDAACALATSTADGLEAAGPRGRARMLTAMADALDGDRDVIVALADRETALGEARLRGEVARSSAQLRLFAGVLGDGGYLGVTIDHPDPQAIPPRPDLRRMMVPLGPVAVFAASNFPLAFSVPGGDTASALAAGCPVVVKANPGHPATSERCAQVLRSAAVASGFPADVVQVVHGRQAGTELVLHPAVRAVGFTGSRAGGRALFELATDRPQPIPFYGELGSINPLVITAAAARERADDVAAGVMGSYTMGMGQFCTKPGVVIMPAGGDGRRLREALADGTRGYTPAPMLAEHIVTRYAAGAAERTALAGVELVAQSPTPTGDGFLAPARLVATRAATLLMDAGTREAVFDECFGPLTVLVEYQDERELLAIIGTLPGTLTATVHAGAGEPPESLRPVLEELRRRAGRVIWDGFPTGVAVTWAMQHGGPYPSSTDARTTSVGTAAIERWLRPVSYQSVPDALLPEPLRESNPWRLPRRVDGVLAAG